MSENIVAQDGQDVKLSPADLGLEECGVEWCRKPIFRRGLCWDHFIAEKTAEWDAQDAERQIALEGTGYVLGDTEDPALDRDWWGLDAREVYGDDHYLPG